MLDKAIQYDESNSYNYYIKKGSFYSKNGNHGKAIDIFDIAIGLEPDVPIAYFNKIVSLFFMDMIAEAYVALRECVKYNSNYMRKSNHYIQRLYA